MRTQGALSPNPSSWYSNSFTARENMARLKGENQLPNFVQGIQFERHIEVSYCRLTNAAGQPRHQFPA